MQNEKSRNKAAVPLADSFLGNPASGAESVAGGAARPGRIAADSEFARWMAKYAPVERAIMEARAKRLEAAEKRRLRCRLALAAECEATEGRAKARHGGGGGPDVGRRACGGHRARIGRTSLRVLDGGILSVLFSAVGVVCTRDLDAARHSLKRPLYYERENARRRRLAEDRRKVARRTTMNPCPTREEVLDAWIHARDSREAMLRFGGMMEDLECYVDNLLRFGAAGEVVGRGRGIKGWLQENIPALWVRYKTVMRYKAAAKKLRQVLELRDPTPLSSILYDEIPVRTKSKVERNAGGGDGGDGEFRSGEAGNEIMLRTKSEAAPGGADPARGQGGSDGNQHGKNVDSRGVGRSRRGVAELRARAVYLEAMEGVPDNATRTIARLDELLDPERVEDATMLKAWKERYENEISLRTKRRWLGRLFKRTG